MKSGAFEHGIANAETVETRAQHLDYLRLFWAEDERIPLAHLQPAPHQRRALVLSLDGMGRAEVAAALKITPSAVDAALRGALSKVRIPIGKAGL